MEMARRDIGLRLLSMRSGVPIADLTAGEIPAWGEINTALAGLKGLPLRVDDSTVLTVERIRLRARQTMREQAQAGLPLGLVIVDYVQLIEAPGGGRRDGNRNLELAAISRSLKALAPELNVPVMAISQLNLGACAVEICDNRDGMFMEV